MKRGFTLIELLVVVLIIGILSAVALPQYQKAVTKARLAQLDTTVDALRKGISIWLLENGGYPSTTTTFVSDSKSMGILSIDVDGHDDVFNAYCSETTCEIHFVSNKFSSEMLLENTDGTGAKWEMTTFSAAPSYKSTLCQWAEERFDYTCS